MPAGGFTPIVIGILFAGTLSGVDRLAFRDVSHFYRPLYASVADRCPNLVDGVGGGRSWLPLWNPSDQTGMPLIGETTTAVLYPLRMIVFSIPVATDVAMGWYVAIHLVIGSLAAGYAARRAGVRGKFHTVAGAIYPLSGGVFFLYTNPPFLVSASWMPLAVGAILSTPSRSRVRGTRHVGVAGFALAMMVLGGDPQTALHAVMAMVAASVIAAVWKLFAGLSAECGWVARRGGAVGTAACGGVGVNPTTTTTVPRSRRVVGRALSRTGAQIRVALGPLVRSLVGIVAASTLAALVAAPQIAASVDWSRQSGRVSKSVSVKSGSVVSSSPGRRDDREEEEAWRRQERDAALQFSLPPWQTATLATPNACGSMLPRYRRWTALLPGDGRTWTPTIYVGGFGFLVLLGVFPVTRLLGIFSATRRSGSGPRADSSASKVRLGSRRHRGPNLVRIWGVIAVAGLLLSFGRFGLGDATLMPGATGDSALTGDSTGGIYGVLYDYFPFYDAFRYPAKWLPFFSLGVAILASDAGRRTGHAIACGFARRSAFRAEVFRVALTRSSLSLGAAALVVGLVTVGARGVIASAGSGTAGSVAIGDVFWGPLDLAGSWADFDLSLWHTGQVGLAFSSITLALVVLRSRRRASLLPRAARVGTGLPMSDRCVVRPSVCRRAFRSLLLVLIVADLGFACRGILYTVNREEQAALWAAIKVSPGVLRDPSRGRTLPELPRRYLRTQVDGGWPRHWRQTQSVTRLAEVEAATRAAWLGRWHLESGVGVFNSMVTIRPSAMDDFWRSVDRVRRELSPAERRVFWRRCKRWLGIQGESQATADSRLLEITGRRYRVVDLKRVLRGVASADGAGRLGPALWRITSTWDVADGRIGVKRFDAMLRRIAHSRDGGRPILHGASVLSAPSDVVSGATSVEVLSSSAESATVDVDVVAMSLLWRPTFQDGNWSAEIRRVDERAEAIGGASARGWRGVPVHQVDAFGQGVLIPPGHWRVRFGYAPAWLAPSICACLFGLLATASVMLLERRRRGVYTTA